MSSLPDAMTDRLISELAAKLVALENRVTALETPGPAAREQPVGVETRETAPPPSPPAIPTRVAGRAQILEGEPLIIATSPAPATKMDEYR